MNIKLKSALAINIMMVVAMVTTPALLELKQIFAEDDTKSNPFEDSTLFDNVPNNIKKKLDNEIFYVNAIPNMGGGDNTKPSTGGDNTKPSTGGDNTKPSTGGDNTKPSTGGSSGAPCGSSGKSTFHWYCHGTHHHCLKGEDKCELFGGRASASAK
jgi:hypothetical protein